MNLREIDAWLEKTKSVKDSEWERAIIESEHLEDVEDIEDVDEEEDL